MSINLQLARLPESDLEFGGSGYFRDPRRGLREAGPFDLRFGSAHRMQVRLAIVGSSEMVDLALEWFDRCCKPIGYPAGHSGPSTVPYDGFNAIFRSDLVSDASSTLRLDQTALDKAMSLAPYECFVEALRIFGTAILEAKRDFRPDVVICAIPENLARRIWSVKLPFESAGRETFRQVSEDTAERQIEMPFDWEPEETPEDLLTRDFRRALKAVAMRYEIPIQIVRRNALLDLKSNEPAAIRAWNLCAGIYYKAGGIPWRIPARGPETCYAGVTFHHLRTTKREIVFSSLAQAYSSNGEGFTLKGSMLQPTGQRRRTPHMSGQQAQDLARKVLDEYTKRNGAAPKRMVLHKSSRFTPEEREGFASALSEVPVVEMVAIAPTSVRLVTHSVYPPTRGTLLTIEGQRHYLFTSGFVSELGTYPGPHVPAPVELQFEGQPGRSTIYEAAQEILALGRLNWNTSDLRSSQPVTLGFARRVGGIMAEYGQMASEDPDPNYRYYM
jgi:hypothetical protein